MLYNHSINVFRHIYSKRCVMNYLKRFTDFCGVFAAFAALVYVMGQFLIYRPRKEELGMLEKLKLFLSDTNAKNYKAYVVMILLLAISVVVGRIFDRLPFVCLSVSFLPLAQILFMYAEGGLYERPMLYVALALIHTSGNILYALSLDKGDGRRRAFLCVNAFGAVISVAAFYMWKRSKELFLMKELSAEEIEAMSDVDLELFEGVGESSIEFFFVIALMAGLTVLVSIILRDLYYIDAILCAVPFGYAVFLFAKEEVEAFAGVTFIILSVYLIFRVLVLLSEPMRKAKVRG